MIFLSFAPSSSHPTHSVLFFFFNPPSSVLPYILSKNGIAGVITFHSLEDRLVKLAFNRIKEEWRGEGRIEVIKHPILPSEKELRENPRSRSAKLRILRRCDEEEEEEEEEEDEEGDEDEEEKEEDNEAADDTIPPAAPSDRSAAEAAHSVPSEAAPTSAAERLLPLHPLAFKTANLLTQSGDFFKQIGRHGRGRNENETGRRRAYNPDESTSSTEEEDTQTSSDQNDSTHKKKRWAETIKTERDWFGHEQKRTGRGKGRYRNDSGFESDRKNSNKGKGRGRRY